MRINPVGVIICTALVVLAYHYFGVPAACGVAIGYSLISAVLSSR